jgi:hypothetical protein
MSLSEELTQYHQGIMPLIVARMHEVFADIRGVDLAGGKHLRGTLCLLVSDALGGDRDRALDYASAVDGLHLGTLQHDDVLDQHTERRGVPTRWVIEGIKAPIIFGDRLMTLAHKRLSLHGKPEMAEVVNALDMTVESVAKEVATKPLELAIDVLSGRVTDVGYRKLCLTKTAPFFKAAARLGAMAADSDRETVVALGDYGERLGVAYQYADDLVDIVKLQGARKMPPWNEIVPVVPAIMHYNGKNIRQALWEVPLGIFKDALTGRGPGERLVALLSQLDVAQQLERDIGKETAGAVEAVQDVDFDEELQQNVRDFPLYIVNLMLAEADKSIGPVVEGAIVEREEADASHQERAPGPTP